jgi:hypothetical protein
MKIADTLIRILTLGRFETRQRPKVLRVTGQRTWLPWRGGPLASTGIRRRSRVSRAMR